MNSIVSAQKNLNTIISPVGKRVVPIEIEPNFFPCESNGVTIVPSGTSAWTYEAPIVTTNTTCTPAAAFSGYGSWTGSSPSGGFVSGEITYTFSPAIISAQISYTAVNSTDSGFISTNSASATLLSNPCGVTIGAGNIITGNFETSWGNTSITVSSTTPFSTITLTNTGGNTGWVTGNPCNFIVVPGPTGPPPPAVVIYSDPKVTLGTLCGGGQTSEFSLYNNTLGSGTPANVNGTPASSANTYVVLQGTLPPGYHILPNGFLSLDSGYLPISFTFNYQLCPIFNLPGVGCTNWISSSVYLCNKMANIPSTTAIDLDIISITPNPSSDGLFLLTFNKAINSPVAIKVYTLIGETVFSKTGLSELQQYLPLNKLSKGTYIVSVTTENQTISKQIVIK